MWATRYKASVSGDRGPLALAVDIGGTFTDLAAVDRRDGSLILAKVDTTPTRLQRGVLSALGRSEIPPADVGVFVHGSTVVINAITERRGSPTALLTTEGFRDVLEIGRANRPDLYNLSYRKPKPFVPRRLRFEVRERISHTGDVVVPLDEAGVAFVADRLRGLGVVAVAICFLRAWTNPDHERRAAELLSKLLRDVEIVASHEVNAQWREYERTSTAVLSAYVKPTVASYLDELRSGVREVGVAAPLYTMRSSGGVSSFDRGRGAHRAARVRSGRRRDRRGRARPASRRPGRAHARHRRDDGEDVGRSERACADRDAASRRADADDGRLSDPGAGRRDRGDRRRRRLDRVGRRGRRPPCRPAERGRRTRAGVLRARRRRADAHRREPRRAARPGVLPGGTMPSTSTPRTGACRDWASGWVWTPRGRAPVPTGHRFALRSADQRIIDRRLHGAVCWSGVMILNQRNP
jgi:Hydantoinase/oxoprolinase N-terminal region/Hydantoinase/oxoprolinase